eukprot:TRINITY_DN21147_c0_g1_i1.p1 TRINITY_DN21147_c0_g1~~TRINITY_DN21147_c0_g1_i1.p1  ORF type:complete len:1650 (-),score=253.47 TRINITY_DN21147_c0_g1_i1:67-5016(-)
MDLVLLARLLSLLLTSVWQPVNCLTVQVVTEAAWPQAPLAAELLEGLAEVGQRTAYLKALSAKEVLDEVAWRRVVGEVAAAQLFSGDTSAFARFLSLLVRHGFFSTKVEATRQLERSHRRSIGSAVETCPVGSPWVAVAVRSKPLKVLCSEEELRQLTTFSDLPCNDKAQPATEHDALLQSPLDHVLLGELGSSDGTFDLEVVGYADLGNPTSAFTFLRELFGLIDAIGRAAASGKRCSCRVAFRHAEPAKEFVRVARLSGYGVDLLSRSADEVTKATEETENILQQRASVIIGKPCNLANGSAGLATSVADVDPAERFYGIDTSVLAQRSPAAASALCAMREDLRVAAEAALKPWHLKRLGARAALRAVQAVKGERRNDRAGLAVLEEIAQDFLSGWGHALEAGGVEEEAAARAYMDKTKALPFADSDDSFEINGLTFARNQRSALHFLSHFAPLFRGVEMLARVGFTEAVAIPLLRDSVPRDQASLGVAAADPRLPGAAPVVLIHDMRKELAGIEMSRRDVEAGESWPPKSGTSASALMSMVQLWGRAVSWPGPAARPLVAFGLTLDPCVRAQLQTIDALDASFFPGVVWVHLVAASVGNPKVDSRRLEVVARLRGALYQLVEGGFQPSDIRKFLLSFASDGDGTCDHTDVNERIEKHWKKLWKGSAPEITPLATEPAWASGAATRLPPPCATLNGRVIFGADLMKTSSWNSLFSAEISRLLTKIRFGHIGLDVSDEDIANALVDNSESAFLPAWHPRMRSGSAGFGSRYEVVSPDIIRNLVGGLWEGDSGPDSFVSHLMLLGDFPLSGEDSGGPPDLARTAAFIDAYATHLAETSDDNTSRLFSIGVDGGCTSWEVRVGAELTLAGALRRCLAAVSSTGSSVETLQPFALRGVAFALEKASPASSVIALLQACASEANESPRDWPGGERLNAPAVVDELDATLCDNHQAVLQSVGPVPPGFVVAVVNGRVFGPLRVVEDGVRFSSDQIQLFETLEQTFGPSLRVHSSSPFRPVDGERGGCTSPLCVATRALHSEAAGHDPFKLAFALSVRAKVVADNSKDEMQPGGDIEQAFARAPDELKLHLGSEGSITSPLRIFVVIDPLSSEAQRLPPLLRMLHDELGAEVGILLHPKPLVKPPILSYYRAAPVPPAPDGGLAGLGSIGEETGVVRFSVPARKGLMLSMQLRAPDAWMCSAVDSGGADLDSLAVEEEGGIVRARYVLEAFFIDGIAHRRGTVDAASGRQLALVPFGGAPSGSDKDVAGADSVVVKSGYFQLRAPPGLYMLSLRGGSVDEPADAIGLTRLVGFGTTLKSSVLGPTAAELEATGAEVSERHAYDGTGGDPNACNETIHIFSVASGHRYERLLRIMIMSVRKHTQCPLRIWLVDNFLSPHFRQVLPELGRRVGFTVSRVTYKWPSWLRVQTQKQRVIWAYKILFLDVLFPAQVDRVLFVDADQIVRADVREVVKTDLKDAVYGFVPFCGSGPQSSLRSILGSWSGEAKPDELKNNETVGFRFWEQGFWERHLGTKKHYHISALFVVDLVKFRAKGAGDILRDVYQRLTADPTSLANLDQDLPNFVQDEIPIFSLPQDWLWCESWCSETSKARAKTIDMCQNPVRKEGKLQQARRIAPEWVQYDSQLEQIIQDIQVR